MSPASADEVLIDAPAEGVRRITMNRPDKLNAMTAGLVTGLHDALDSVAADRSCRVVMLTGAGRGFCAGLDLNGFGPLAGQEGRGPIQQGLNRKHRKVSEAVARRARAC